MEQLTGLGKAVMTTDPDKLRLDRSVKNILAYKPILARIIKEAVTECHDMDYDEVEACIGEKVLISKMPVDSGITNMPERIDGLNTEAFLNYEGLDRYDIRTYLLISKGRIAGEGGGRASGCRTGRVEADGDEVIKLLINVEAQNEDKPGYDLPLRALFYCCRMISAQQDVEFTTNKDDPVKYGNIKKVYSIWVCTEAAQIRANSIEKYDISRKFLYGYNPDTPRYDILEAVLINISEKRDTGDSDNELINMMTCLFDTRISAVEKVRQLKDDYHLRVSRNIDEEVALMGSFADGFEKKIRREVEQELKGDYDRKLAESRQQTEESKKEAEESRQQAEESKKEAEESKKEAEESRQQAEESRQQAEESKKEAEESKKEAEESKKQAEESRQQAEASKKEAEASRKQVEESKKQAEASKKQAEESRQQAEASKKQAEESRQQAEASKKQAEESKKEAEESKREAEENRRQFIAILVRSLSSHTDSFDQMYKEVTSNNIFADVTREELKQIMASASCALSTT